MQDFFTNNSIWFLLGLAVFPRITLLFATSLISGWFWLVWLFFPRIWIAILAIPYWDTNPVLVIFAVAFAITGTIGESSTTKRIRK